MTNIRLLAFLLTAIFILPQFVTPAAAQATRTWVSGVGDDANPCSRTAPCKTFAGAISKTAAGGQISVLDPGGFGAVTITKSISIVANGDLGSILAAGTNGIVINAAATDVINLHGLEIHGASKGAVPGLSAVRVLGGGRVNITDCYIHDFSVAGVEVAPTVVASRVVVDNSRIVNANIGVLATATAVSGQVTVSRTSLLANTTAGVKADGAQARVIVFDSLVNGSTTDFVPVNTGAVVSFGNNATVNTGDGTINSVKPMR